MSFRLNVPRTEVGPSSSGPRSRDEEARQLCRAFRDEQYELDEVATAVSDGGLAAGYAAFLQKFQNNPVQVVPRTWKDAPDSQEYKERQECFEKSYLDHLRRVRTSPFKYSHTNAYLDLKSNENLRHGFRVGS